MNYLQISSSTKHKRNTNDVTFQNTFRQAIAPKISVFPIMTEK